MTFDTAALAQARKIRRGETKQLTGLKPVTQIMVDVWNSAGFRASAEVCHDCQVGGIKSIKNRQDAIFDTFDTSLPAGTQKIQKTAVMPNWTRIRAAKV